MPDIQKIAETAQAIYEAEKDDLVNKLAPDISCAFENGDSYIISSSLYWQTVKVYIIPLLEALNYGVASTRDYDLIYSFYTSMIMNDIQKWIWGEYPIKKISMVTQDDKSIILTEI